MGTNRLDVPAPYMVGRCAPKPMSATSEAEVGGERLVGRRFAARLGKARQGEIGGHRLALAMARDADDIADLLLDDDAQILARQQFGRAQMGEQNRRSDRRMSGERQFPRRRENPQPRRIDRVARLFDEDRLGQVEFARDRLHPRVVEPLAVEDDGEGISGERDLGEDVERVELAAHRTVPRIRSATNRREGRTNSSCAATISSSRDPAFAVASIRP